MSRKRLMSVLSIVAAAFILSGCTTSSELITLDTKFTDVMSDGFFSALIVYPLAQAINWLEPKIGIFLAITLITVVLHAIVLAFTFKSNVAMQRMQEVQPEIQKIQAKYEGSELNTSRAVLPLCFPKEITASPFSPMTSRPA